MNLYTSNSSLKSIIEVKEINRSGKSNNKKLCKENTNNTKHQIHCLEILRSGIGKVALVVLIGFLLERTCGIVKEFLREPTYFETQYVPQYHADLPALTICPLYGYKSSVLKVICFETLN